VLIYPVNAKLNFTATAPTGQVVQAVALVGSSGTTVSGTQSTLAATISLLTGRVTATPTCATPTRTNVRVTVNTNRSGNQIPVGITGVGASPNSYTSPVPSSTTITLTAPATFVNSLRVGFRLNGWSPADPTVTVPSSGSITDTANYTDDADAGGVHIGPRLEIVAQPQNVPHGVVEERESFARAVAMRHCFDVGR
jgi:hypothetical protein